MKFGVYEEIKHSDKIEKEKQEIAELERKIEEEKKR